MIQLPWTFDFAAGVFGKQGGSYPIMLRLAAGRDGTLPALATPELDPQRYDNVWDLDLRLAKNIKLGSGSVVLSAELFNALNNNVVLSRSRQANTGTFTSTVFDAGQQVTWDSGHWTADVPTGTSITIQVRAGNTSSPDGSWTGWLAVTMDAAILDSSNNPLHGRFLQYRAIMTTNSSTATPVLKDISFMWE